MEEGRKKRILIIDDEENFAKSIKFSLERAGAYEVKMETESMRAMALAKKFRPDLILLDIIMPHVDGSDVCFQLKEDEDTKNIPVIFLTAVVNKDETGVIGSYSFVSKPVEISELIGAIEKNIGWPSR